MSNPRFYISGKEIDPPENWKDLSIELDYHPSHKNKGYIPYTITTYKTKPMKKTNEQLEKEVKALQESNDSLRSTVGTLNEVSDKLSKEKKELEKNQIKPQPFEI